jgi:hypothetical protein
MMHPNSIFIWSICCRKHMFVYKHLKKVNITMNISFDVVVKLMYLWLFIIFIGMHANNKDIGSVLQDTLVWNVISWSHMPKLRHLERGVVFFNKNNIHTWWASEWSFAFYFYIISFDTICNGVTWLPFGYIASLVACN